MQRLRRAPLKTAGILGAMAAALAAVVLLLGSGDSSGEPLKVHVFAKQYSWRFGYPSEGNAFSAKALHVPTGRPIKFELHSVDVVHGFWIPDWDIKTDAIPGGAEKIEATPREAGVYQLVCSVSCGLLHRAMRAKIVVEEPAQFQRWANSLGPMPARWRRVIRLDREAEAIRRSVEGEEAG